MRNLLSLTLLLAAIAAPAAAQTTEVLSGSITSDRLLDASTEYELAGFTFVDAGATLTIPPGTVIKARPQSSASIADGGTGGEFSTLVVRRGARLVADATAQEPIIFTSTLEDVDDPDDGIDPLTQAPLRGLWGGLVLLGEAPTNQTGAAELVQVEGIDPNLYEAQYGCDVDGDGQPSGAGPCDDDDDSGTLRYVSIRHAGAELSTDNELNGLTMGAVGRGTTIEYVEVYANDDDCFEWFGGTVNTKYLVGAFCGDEAFDYDQGYRGHGQFWFAIQAADEAGYGNEFDGTSTSTGAVNDTDFSLAVVSNATYIGSGAAATVSGGDGNPYAFRIRENAGAKFFNSIVTDFAGSIFRLDTDALEPDTDDRLAAGDVEFGNNLFFGFGDDPDATSFDELIRADAAVKASLIAALTANENVFADPMLGGIDREVSTQGLDPRPDKGSPAIGAADFSFEELDDDSGDDFFTEVDYIGAFEPSSDPAALWISSWTALDQNGTVGDLVDRTVAVEDGTLLPEDVTLSQNYPNPFNPETTIAFELGRSQGIRLTVFDLMGREVAVLIDGMQAAGAHEVAFDARTLPSGTYLYRLQTEARTYAKTMLLLK